MAGTTGDRSLGSARTGRGSRQRGRAPPRLRRDLRRARPTHRRVGGRSMRREVLAEATATFGLVLLIVLGVRKQSPGLPAAVAVYIVGAYWFTASTSFANPAVTIARSLSNTFAGIAPADAPAFIVSQVVGALLALA